MTRITIDNARELLNSDKLLVMLYGPTEHSKLEPVVEEVSHEYEGRINVVICSLLIQDDIAIDFDIRGYPSLLFFKKGELVGRLDRTIGRDALVSQVQKLI